MNLRITAIKSFAAALSTMAVLCSAVQAPVVRSADEKDLREYAGVYSWGSNSFVYLQMWSEFTGSNQLVAFDESGDVRTLYPTEKDQFFTGPGAAVSTTVESKVQFHRDAGGRIISLTMDRDGSGPRTAQRIDRERREDVGFSNGDVRLAGTLMLRAAVRSDLQSFSCLHRDRKTASTSFHLRTSWCATGWQYWGTTNEA
jgi:hypothetical protein